MAHISLNRKPKMSILWQCWLREHGKVQSYAVFLLWIIHPETNPFCLASKKTGSLGLTISRRIKRHSFWPFTFGTFIDLQAPNKSNDELVDRMVLCGPFWVRHQPSWVRCWTQDVIGIMLFLLYSVWILPPWPSLNSVLALSQWSFLFAPAVSNLSQFKHSILLRHLAIRRAIVKCYFKEVQQRNVSPILH